MTGIFRHILNAPRNVLIGVVKAYQLVISPHTRASCRYTPTCSQYALLALQKYGFVRGGILTMWRLLRCQPWGGHGYDPPRWFGEPVAVDPVDAAPAEQLPTHHE